MHKFEEKDVADTATPRMSGCSATSVRPKLLCLPRELRDIIYDYYLRSPAGYAYRFETNKLTNADASSISLSLAFTCRQIATEMKGLALRVNKITFTTFFSKATRESAGMFHAALKNIALKQVSLLNHLVPRLLTLDMMQSITSIYPQFWPLLSNWRLRDGKSILGWKMFDFGEVPSIWLDFVHYTLVTIAQHPDYREEVKLKALYWQANESLTLELANTFLEPWSIPDATELDGLCSVAQFKSYNTLYCEGLEYSYSATSSAIRFLRSLPTSTRKDIRELRLLEDRESVADSACHARGLIPYCRENLKLRVECSVRLWETIFPVHGKDGFLQAWQTTDQSDTGRLQASAPTGSHCQQSSGCLGSGMPRTMLPRHA